MTHFLYRHFILLLSLIVLPSCVAKRQFILHQKINKKNVPLFIAFPKNKLIAPNITPLLYKQLVKHYKQIGYHLTNKPTISYTLQSTLTKFEHQYNYISPDVLLFHSITTLEILIELLDTNQKSIVKRTFSSSILLSKPRNPTMNNSFSYAAIDKSFVSLAIQIEQYFRKYLITKEKQ